MFEINPIKYNSLEKKFFIYSIYVYYIHTHNFTTNVYYL